MRLLLLFLFTITICPLVNANDADSLRTRLRNEYILGVSDSAVHFLDEQLSNGSWSVINYEDKSSVDWQPVKHLARLRQMAVAYNNAEHSHYSDSILKEGILSGLDFWYDNDSSISSTNWWYNDIGQQLQLGPILAMMFDSLDSVRIARGAGFMMEPGMTGQNKLWLAKQTVWKGCIRRSVTDINRGLNAIKGEVYLSTGEGIQHDYSFHQHGALLYSGGYGRGFLYDVVFWVVMSQRLSFAFDSAKLSILNGFILDGSQWMIRRSYWDYAVGGREIARKTWGRATSGLLRDKQSSRVDEILRFVDHIEGKNDSALTGNRHFWRSDYHVHRRKNFHLSIRMCSDRVYGSESINNENMKNNYLSFGSISLLRTGDEYYEIFPMWDWGRIPGVTSPYKWNPGGSTFKGTTKFAGGASNGVYGVAGLDLNRDGVTGRKAWFCFENDVVALGASIKRTSGTEPVYTSLNQCWLRGEVWSGLNSGMDEIQPQGLRTLESPKWIFHDSVGYIFPSATSLTIKNEEQTGTWYSINRQYSTDVAVGDVFSLWINHGVIPSDAQYEYVMLSGVSRDDVKNYADSIPFSTLSNTEDLQAVRHELQKVSGAVFYKEGYLLLRYGLAVEVDKPCIILVDESGDKYRVTVSNPLNTSSTVNVSLYTAGGVKETVPFILPSGNNAGSSVIMEYTASVIQHRSKSFVKVTVIDSVSRNPIENVKVREVNSVSVPVYTNSYGEAFFPSDSGNIAIEASIPFYAAKTTQISVMEGDTGSLEITISPLNISSIKIVPDDDAYVRSGTPYNSQNYGLSSTLVAKIGGTIYDRDSYLKFDLSAIDPAKMIGAVLRLYTMSKQPATAQSVVVYGVSDNNWQESTITWNNKPSIGSAVVSRTIAADTLMYHEWNVFEYVSANSATDGIVSFCVRPATNAITWLSFASKEDTVVWRRPYLEIFEDSMPTGVGQGAIQEIFGSIGISVSPNPFNPAVRISVKGWQKGMDLNIVDVNGKVVASMTARMEKGMEKSVTWKASGLSSGLYLAVLRNGGTTIRKKMMLIR